MPEEMREDELRAEGEAATPLPPGMPPVLVIPGGGPPPPPMTIKALAWKVLIAFSVFLVIVALTTALVTWLWNNNLAAVSGLPELDWRTTASAVIIFRLSSFVWRM